MTPIRLASLALALAFASVPAPARACSCISITYADLEQCRTAKRVFAGTIDSLDWPLAYRALADRSVEIQLAVDTVWRGEVPARLVVETDPLGGPGSCTRYPPPGQRFLICDHEDGGPPPLSFCDRPALGDEVRALSAALGPGAPPAPAPWRPPWWLDRARLADSAHGVFLLFAPFAVALLGAAAGALVRRLRPLKRPPRSVPRSLALLLAVALFVIIVRLALHAALHGESANENLLARCVIYGPSVLAGALGLALAYPEQRRGRRLRGLAFAFAAVVTVLIAGYMRLHSPWQPADVVACSEARARVHLRAYADMPKDEWARSAPTGCADWGLSRVRADTRGPSVRFPDGRGGEHWLFPNETNYRWELP